MDDLSHDWPERLRALPPLEPPPRVWAAIASRRRARRTRWAHSIGFALAASLVMAVALMTLGRPTEAHVVPPYDPALSTLASRSADLGRLLTEIEPTRRVLDLETAGTIVALEDRLALVDAHLRRASLAPDEATELWRQRVDLMEALVGVHATSGRYAF